MSSRRASPVVAATFLALLTAAPASAARPELDVASARRPTPAARERLARLTSDPQLAAIATPAHVDERYGVPNFVWATRGSRPATPGTSATRDVGQVARDHLARLAPYYGLDEDDVRNASLRDIHDTGVGGIIVSLRQSVDGIEVFRDEIKILMDRDMELLAVTGFIPGKAEAGRPAARAFRIAAQEAIARALDDYGVVVDRSAIHHQAQAPGGYDTFEIKSSITLGLQDPIRVKRVLFHLPGELIPGYYIELIGQEAVSYVVSATDGGLLFRHGLTQSDAFSYRVWADNTTLHAPLDGPQGNGTTPHPTGTPNGLSPAFIPPVLQTLQNGPISTNDPWLPPGATTTLGNNVDAYADLVAPDGFNAGDLRASTTGTNSFDRTYDTSLDPEANADQTMASVTQLFYTTNFLHDWFYDAGFDEASGNAQASNYGRGGVEGDRLNVEAQDYFKTNNADMMTPADGASPRMQMYEFLHLGLPHLTVNSPAGISGPKPSGDAEFNPFTFNVTAEVVPVSTGAFSVAGTFTLPAPAGPEFVTALDVTSDGVPELLSANFSGSVSVWRGDPNNGFFRTDVAVGTGTYVLATGDVNGDNKVDLATANNTAGTVSVLVGDGAGGFGSRVDYASGPSPTWVVLADVSGDGKLDLISSNWSSHDVAVRLGNGSGGFGALVSYATGINPNTVLVGDMNGDGKGDLVTANYAASSVSVLLGDGSGGFGAKTDFTTGALPLTCALGDMNHDQKLDVITADYGANTVSILLGTGTGALGSPSPTSVPGRPVTVVVGDLNDDPYLDLAVCCDLNNSVSIMIGNGAGGVAAPVNYSVGTVPFGVYIGDVTGDGEPDVVAGNYVSNDLTVLSGSAVPSTLACTNSFVNSFAGKIALVDRGVCPAGTKMANVKAQGAVGVIVVNNVPGVSTLLGSGDGSPPYLPTVMVSPEDGAAIRAAFANGPVSVTMSRQVALTRDGALDNQMVAHEWGHYLSHRLVGNASGLTNLQGQGMSEGWGDFVALLLEVKPEDSAVPSNPSFSGTYTAASYSEDISGDPDDAYYFGTRRYPYSTDLARNPLTFQHIQNSVPLPAGPPSQLTAPDHWEVHNTGEVWCSMLWECYASLLRATGRLTFDQARTRMRQYAVAGLKLTPITPTFVEARDAILAAVAAANDPADFADFCAAFAKRGIGMGAVAPDRTSSTLEGVSESYVCGGDLQVIAATLDDAVHACDADGVLDGGEVGRLTVTVKNIGVTTLSATSATLSSTNPAVVFQSGPTLIFPPSAPLATTTAQAFVRSSSVSGIQSQDFLIQCNDPGLLAAGPRTLAFTTTGNFDSFPSTTEHVEAPNPGWTYTQSSVPEAWRRIAKSPIDHRFYAPDAVFTSDKSLISPPLQVGASPFSFTFRHAYSFENAGGVNYDGGVAEISTDGGSTWTDIGATITPGYGGTITNISGNPLGGRPAFVRKNPSYPVLAIATANLGTTYAGMTVRVRFRLGTDEAVGFDGWHVDDLVFTGLTNTPFVDVVADPGPCTSVAVEEALPTEVSFAVAGAQPSRAAPSFQFALPRPTRVEITVHDLAGRRVARLADGEYAAGVHAARWDEASGGVSSPGVYFARMIAGGRVITRRVVVLSK